MIARKFPLLERSLVLLIDHDQPEPVQGGEDRAARADHDLSLSLADPPPFDVSFDIGQMAVQNGDRVEPLAKTAHRLRSQADFRDEDDRLFSETDRFGNRLKIDFRFAAAGYAVQKDRLVGSRSDVVCNTRDGFGLVRVQFERGRSGNLLLEFLKDFALPPYPFGPEESHLSERENGDVAGPRRMGQFAQSHRFRRFLEHVECHTLFRG